MNNTQTLSKEELEKKLKEIEAYKKNHKSGPVKTWSKK